MKRRASVLAALAVLGVSILFSSGCSQKEDVSVLERAAVSEEYVKEREENETASEDVMLTYAPDISLTDMLSSTMNGVKLQAGSCSWRYSEGADMVGIEACGAHPLDEAFLERVTKWELPEYQNMDYVPVSVSCTSMPDKITVREWGMDAVGDYEAEAFSVTAYEYPVLMFEIRPDRIYEVSAVWEEKSGIGYYGEASYVLTTE